PSTWGIKTIDWRETTEPVYMEESVMVANWAEPTFTEAGGKVIEAGADSDFEHPHRATRESKPSKSDSQMASAGIPCVLVSNASRKNAGRDWRFIRLITGVVQE